MLASDAGAAAAVLARRGADRVLDDLGARRDRPRSAPRPCRRGTRPGNGGELVEQRPADRAEARGRVDRPWCRWRARRAAPAAPSRSAGRRAPHRRRRRRRSASRRPCQRPRSRIACSSAAISSWIVLTVGVELDGGVVPVRQRPAEAAAQRPADTEVERHAEHGRAGRASVGRRWRRSSRRRRRRRRSRGPGSRSTTSPTVRSSFSAGTMTSTRFTSAAANALTQ